MTSQKILTPKGMRDFGPQEMAKRNYIFNTIESVFRLYGFEPIQTPSMEMLSVLMGKYGDEGDKLLFRVQNSGLKASQTPEKGLKYDLTVPFARFVVQHKEELVFPFKRYQIQPVWRADKPQKGRYREFVQCDADIIGTNTLLAEKELINIIQTTFSKLHIPIIIKVNNRKILAGIAEYLNEKDKLVDITTAIDKLDKVSFDIVKDELERKNINPNAINGLQEILSLNASIEDKLLFLNNCFVHCEIGKKGIEEMQQLLSYLDVKEQRDDIRLTFDVALARGLNYYTGTIIEVKAQEMEIGALSGGGRYDNLTAIFGTPDMSGVGISFGADRIYDVMEEKQLFPSKINQPSQILLVALGQKELTSLAQWAETLRQNDIAALLIDDTFYLSTMWKHCVL